jgi:hypothetical protein
MARLRTGLFQSGRARGAAAGVVTFAVALLALSPVGGRAAGLSFTADYVSTSLAGGEPFVIYSHAANDLVYSGHEGTTHLYNGGGTPAPGDTCDIHTAQGFVCSYNNQVNNWYSTDQGLTWTKSPGNPAYTGFSDPSLTEDAAGPSSTPLVYNTGIDLANDALFASQDGGKTWIAGTPQCHEGDRPWLAGGKNGEVFMGTDSSITSHLVVKGTVTFAPVTNTALSITCSTTTIPDPAATTGSGIGDQLYYDHNAAAGPNGALIEPARFNPGASGCPAGSGVCLGISVLPNASTADFTSVTSTSSFVAHADPVLTSFNDALGPRIIIGPDDTIYLVWATGPTTTGTNNCGGATPVANQVLMAYTTDEGVTWSPTKLIAQMTNAVAWWPWAAAGPSGNVSIVWYQSNQITDPDCDSAHSVLGLPSTSWTVQIANIYGAGAASYPPVAANAVPNFDTLHAGGVIHVGAICQNGTTCALNTQAGNEDRRLGDYFTNALDQNGCVMIATADTQLSDSTPVVGGGGFRTGRPLFVHQASGPSLTTGLDCAAFAPNIPEAPTMTALLAAGALAVGAAVLVGRRRRLTPV